MEPLPPATHRRAHAAGRRRPVLRRPDGADPVRRADGPRGDQRRDLHGASAPTRSPASTAARRAGRHGRLSRRRSCPDEVARVRRGGGGRRGRGALAARSSTTSATGSWRSSTAPNGAPVARGLRPDRRSSAASATCPIGLVEAGRGCHFKCEFCAVQTDLRSDPDAPADRRDPRRDRIASSDTKKLFFFVDDNITSNLRQAKEFFRALIPLRHPLGEPGEHQRRARRGVPRPARAQRLPGRADRLREPRTRPTSQR